MKLRKLRLGTLSIDDWEIRSGESWCILGGNASGKSQLSALIAGDAEPEAGSVCEIPSKVAALSFESLQAAYEAELADDDTDFLDRIDYGSTGRELLTAENSVSGEPDSLTSRYGLEHLLDRGCRQFSTGEMRRIHLLRAVLQEPDLLVLDEPFEGLDAKSREDFSILIGDLVEGGHSVLLLVSRVADVSPSCSHLAILRDGRFIATGLRSAVLASPAAQQLLQLDAAHAPNLPAPPREATPPPDPLLRLVNCSVVYNGVYQFEGLDWTLRPGEHTLIAGPNGCGKSTLLELLTGDHPQCYSNQIEIFGYERGSGESIWDIKRHLGLVSPAFHRDYRVRAQVETVVVSGIFDSIGLYQEPSSRERRAAREWLHFFGMGGLATRPFHSLSYGQQRLALIARALVKLPPLLILDEPTQGLDDLNRHLVLTCLERLAALRGTTLLFVTHRDDEQLALFRHRLHFAPSAASSCRYAIQLSRIDPS